MEKIYSVVTCSEEQKVTFAAFMLKSDAEFWWFGTRRLLEASGALINWELFKTYFYEKYFLESVRNAKDIEFMHLAQGGSSVAQYTAKFEELIKFSRVFQGNPDEVWKCVKYESGLTAELNFAVAHMEIRDFPTLVNKCRILEEGRKKINATRAERAKGLGPQVPRFKPQQSRSYYSPYQSNQFRQQQPQQPQQRPPFTPQSRQQVRPPFQHNGQRNFNNNQQRGSGGPRFNQGGSSEAKYKAPQGAPAAHPGTPPADVCTKCGKNHGNRPCMIGQRIYFKCGKPGHYANVCTSGGPSNQNPRQQHQGRVFTLNAEDA